MTVLGGVCIDLSRHFHNFHHHLYIRKDGFKLSIEPITWLILRHLKLWRYTYWELFCIWIQEFKLGRIKQLSLKLTFCCVSSRHHLDLLTIFGFPSKYLSPLWFSFWFLNYQSIFSWSLSTTLFPGHPSGYYFSDCRLLVSSRYKYYSTVSICFLSLWK